jgi:uncharacterized caspase-like protein
MVIAAERVALIVGNSSYVHSGRLKNPVNDAVSLTTTFTRLGFAVTTGIDLTKEDMVAYVDSFSNNLKDAKVALFFYAGHGMALNGKNYLIPIDFEPKSDLDLMAQLISLDGILNEMAGGERVNIVLLDACRDNPLANSLTASMSSGRSLTIEERGVKVVGQGLAEMKGEVGTLIGYATQPGNVASDGAGTNSPFTQGLLKHLEEPGLEIREILTRVRVSVVKETDNKQIPWDHSSLVKDFYFKKKKRKPAPPP